MKRYFTWAIFFVLALTSLSACGPSAAEEERRAAQRERERLHEERKEVLEERKDVQKEREDRARIEDECTVSYNTCVTRCDTLVYAESRAACVADCTSIRTQCLRIK